MELKLWIPYRIEPHSGFPQEMCMTPRFSIGSNYIHPPKADRDCIKTDSYVVLGE